MAAINRVGHVVLYVSDVSAAVDFYRDALGMETVRYDPERGMAFMSFGAQHHDIGLFKVRGEETRGSLGLGHIALAVDGGLEDLEEMHARLASHGANIKSLTDHGMTKSVYFEDPDGNRLEIYCDTMSQEEGKRFLSDRPGRGVAFTFEEVGATSQRLFPVRPSPTRILLRRRGIEPSAAATAMRGRPASRRDEHPSGDLEQPAGMTE